eukprot:TRINITY_DN7335_c0_g1_i1.p1 TRINITY_DN7335_c0_g1~~TRINITY_DN7335_c0_g1_i1.p1  ORF type:complete len:135 (+),score=15.71 TRINITY_DN7335_c0_g1_i1:84-488(+)
MAMQDQIIREYAAAAVAERTDFELDPTSRPADVARGYATDAVAGYYNDDDFDPADLPALPPGASDGRPETGRSSAMTSRRERRAMHLERLATPRSHREPSREAKILYKAPSFEAIARKFSTTELVDSIAPFFAK